MQILRVILSMAQHARKLPTSQGMIGSGTLMLPLCRNPTGQRFSSTFLVTAARQSIS